MSLHVLAQMPQQTDMSSIDTTMPFLPENETEVLRQLLLHEHLFVEAMLTSSGTSPSYR